WRNPAPISLLGAHLWDVATGKEIGAGLRHPPIGDGVATSVSFARFSLDGKLAITLAGDSARIWDAATGQATGAIMRHKDKINYAAFSPDGKRLVTASVDRSARVWDTATGTMLGSPLLHD